MARTLMVVLSLVYAVAGGVGPAKAGPQKAQGQGQGAKPKLNVTTYAVADLVIPIDGKAKQAQTGEQDLMALIQGTVAPSSWASKGGRGQVEYFPATMTLVVNQTPAVQKQIGKLLSAMRHLQAAQASVEMRFIRVPPALAEEFQKENVLPRGGPKDGEPKLALLDEAQFHRWMEVVQVDRSTNVMQAPKMTTFSGQSTTMAVCDKHSFVTDYKVVHEKDRVRIVPHREEVEVGLRIHLTSWISADCRNVRLEVDVKQTSLDRLAPVLPVVLEGAGKAEDKSHCVGSMQKPKVHTMALKTACTIPAGRTAVYHLGQEVMETAHETSPPVLSRIPYISRQFRNVGYGREVGEVFLVITPRVVMQLEEEAAETNATVPQK